MKKAFLLFMAGTGILLAGCSKENLNTNEENNTIIASAITAKGEQVEEVVTVTIPMNTEYRRDLGFFGREEYAEVIKPPAHAAISRVDREGGSIIYTYMPAKAFTGVDEVTIQLNKDSDGTAPKTVTFLRIIFNVEPKQ